jgi:hypothetical protein
VAFLPGFDEDVFISYAHNDDDTYGLEPRGWVAQLHMDLKQRVKVHLGAPNGAEPSLWRDCEIRTYEDFAKKISARLAKTATLLSVISRSYIHREWCVKELEDFSAYAERSFGLRIDDEKWRIFKVEKVPVDRSDWPTPLQQGTKSYKFHGPDPRDSEVHEFRPLLGGEYGIRYFEEMDELAKDIATVLLEMTVKARGTLPAALPGMPVYVAECTSDLEKEANEIRRDLKDRGYIVLPSADLPYRANEFKENVRQCLKRSVLSIHLVGKEYGIIPEGEMEKSNAWLQNDLAMERADDPNFLRLVWMPGDVKPSDKRQQKFLEYLLEDSAAQKGADILTTKLEDLKTSVQDRLREIRRKLEKPQPAAAPNLANGNERAPAKRNPDEPLRVYIICDQLDRKSPSLLALRKYFFSRGYEPILALENEDESDALQEHADNLAICDACVIYYGQGSEKWFSTKLRDFRKIVSRRDPPVLAKAVYIVSPETEGKSELETHEAMVLRGAETFSPDALAPFVNRLVEKS